MSAEVWSTPGEPGPEVTHVRDHHGVRWQREGAQWWANVPGLTTLRPWHVLLATRGPLTDATGEGVTR